MSEYCFHCGAVIDGEGIEHRGKIFCSDECCDAYEEDLTNNGGPDLDDLDEDDLDEDDYDFDDDDGDDNYDDDDDDSDRDY
jgi:hypothetical protein